MDEIFNITRGVGGGGGGGGGGGTIPETKKIVAHICSCITFSPFFCASTFDTSLLLIGCLLCVL